MAEQSREKARIMTAAMSGRNALLPEMSGDNSVLPFDFISFTFPFIWNRSIGPFKLLDPLLQFHHFEFPTDKETVHLVQRPATHTKTVNIAFPILFMMLLSCP